MKKIWKEAESLLRWKPYIICMLVMLIATYGSLVLHPTIGIDDTAWKVYFVDGVAAVMGRWVLYAINKIIPIAEYNPYIVEGFFMVLFMVSATLWVVLLKRILGDRVSNWVYTFFGCVFLGAPITSEVITYYLSNGISIGFGFTALAVWYLWEAFGDEYQGKLKGLPLIYSALWLWLALGCYESFIIVYMVAICIFYAFERGLKGKASCLAVPKVMLATLFSGVLCVVLRSIWSKVSIVIFSLEDQLNVLHYRGMSELLVWFDGEKTLQDFVLVLKQFFVKYYINALMYKPITLMVLGFGMMGLWALIQSIRKKDGIVVLAVIGAMLVPWILPMLEGYATYYRSSQYIVLVNAAIVPAAALLFEKLKNRSWCRIAGFVLAFILLYHEAYEMNYWLKVDQDKYEDACRTMDAVALEIIRDYDESLPVCVVGEYNVPDAIASKSYCPLWSKKYTIASAIINFLDDDLLEEYVDELGYVYAETPLLSVIKWGSVAFYSNDVELIKFWENRGFSFVVDGNLEHYAYGKQLLAEGMPSWPEEGSIVQMDGYIIVNLENNR